MASKRGDVKKEMEGEKSLLRLERGSGVASSAAAHMFVLVLVTNHVGATSIAFPSV